MQDNKTFLSMIKNVLQTDGFYFATDYDLTHTLQRLANTSPEFQEMSLLERVRHLQSLNMGSIPTGDLSFPIYKIKFQFYS